MTSTTKATQRVAFLVLSSTNSSFIGPTPFRPLSWAHPIVYRFNPATRQYDWRNFSEQLNHEDVLPKAGHLGNGYCTVMTSMQNPKGHFEIFHGTGGITKGIKLVFPN